MVKLFNLTYAHQCVFAQIIVLLILAAKCYSLCDVKGNLAFAINTATSND